MQCYAVNFSCGYVSITKDKKIWREGQRILNNEATSAHSLLEECEVEGNSQSVVSGILDNHNWAFGLIDSST